MANIFLWLKSFVTKQKSVKNRVVYLAAPYSHSDPTVVEQRMEQVCKADAFLSKHGFIVVSPLLKHYVVQHESLPTDWEFWQTYAKELLARCDEMFVLKLPGWDTSTGVKAEIEFCKQNKIPVMYMELGFFNK